MTTISRKEKQAGTREAILKAGRRAVIESGIQNLSVRSVCAAAGFSLGAFYSNFGSRTEFLFEICEAFFEDFFAELKVAHQSAARVAPDEIGAVFDQWMVKTMQNEGLSESIVEFEILARRDAEFQALMQPLILRFRDGVAQLIRDLQERHGMVSAIDDLQQANGFMSLWTGIAFQKRFARSLGLDASFAQFAGVISKAALGRREGV